MNRGAFLKNTFFVIAAGSTFAKLPFSIGRVFSSQKHVYDRLFSNLKNGFVLENYANELGAEYLSLQEKNSVNNISKSDQNPEKYLQRMIGKSESPVHHKIQRMIRQDYETYNTVRLKGWILSETEAKLSALYSMTI